MLPKNRRSISPRRAIPDDELVRLAYLLAVLFVVSTTYLILEF